MARRTATPTDEQIKDQAFSELQALIEESERLLSDAASLVGDDNEGLREQINQKLKQVRTAISAVGTRAQPIVEATQTYIGGHPWQTVVLCTGLGVVVGWLIGRKD
jgi:ElaB/YqjD/DUF883 family membrane-anchored ribosome-binding protein